MKSEPPRTAFTAAGKRNLRVGLMVICLLILAFSPTAMAVFVLTPLAIGAFQLTERGWRRVLSTAIVTSIGIGTWFAVFGVFGKALMQRTTGMYEPYPESSIFRFACWWPAYASALLCTITWRIAKPPTRWMIAAPAIGTLVGVPLALYLFLVSGPADFFANQIYGTIYGEVLGTFIAFATLIARLLVWQLDRRGGLTIDTVMIVMVPIAIVLSCLAFLIKTW
jgi:hypothetical protein